MSEPHVCPWWFCWTFDNALRRFFQNPVTMMAPYVGSGDRVMDIGCGMGYFTMGLAQLVGAEGRVYAVDLQTEMLDGVNRRATKKGFSDRIETVKAESQSFNVPGDLDFALAMWMVHETPDQNVFLAQVRNCLRPGGRFYMAEPKFHVSSADVAETEAMAASVGLEVIDRPGTGMSRTVVFEVK